MTEPSSPKPGPATGPSAMPPLGTKPAPAKPAAAAARRGFLGNILSWWAVAWVAFSGGMAALTLGTVRFLYPNVLAEPPSTFKAGSPEEYEPGQVVERYKQEYGTWIVRLENTIVAISTTCTHLGCTPNWLESEQKFKCPCHGSGFYKDGVNFEGPAPRPLERYKISMSDDGQILVDKSKKFQKELGQWNDPDASVTL